MHIKRSIRFILHARKQGDSSEGKGVMIRMRIAFNGNTPLDFSIGHTIDAACWDADKERAKVGYVGSSGQTHYDINRTIDDYRSKIEEIFARYELIEKRIPERNEVRDLFNDMMGRPIYDLPSPETDFFTAYELFITQMGARNQWTGATYQKFQTLKNHIKAFDENISLLTLNDDKLQQFIGYFNKNKYRNTTIVKHLSFFKWFLRWANIEGYYKGTSHETFRPKLKGGDGNLKEIIYLTQREINSLISHEFNENQIALERVRDVFIFCCFTGLRYSDAYKLTHDDVKEDHILIVTQKTTDTIKIELNRYSRMILDKYENSNFPNNKVLPVISNQKMNQYLKDIGRICEINEPQRVVYFKGNQRHEEVYPKWMLLTTHCARRTFVVNALRLGIPAEVIIRWTGHSDYKSMKPYVKIVDELKEQEMSKFNNF